MKFFQVSLLLQGEITSVGEKRVPHRQYWGLGFSTARAPHDTGGVPGKPPSEVQGIQRSDVAPLLLEPSRGPRTRSAEELMSAAALKMHITRQAGEDKLRKRGTVHREAGPGPRTQVSLEGRREDNRGDSQHWNFPGWCQTSPRLNHFKVLSRWRLITNSAWPPGLRLGALAPAVTTRSASVTHRSLCHPDIPRETGTVKLQRERVRQGCRVLPPHATPLPPSLLPRGHR